MKIACISDTHMQHRGLNILPCDVLIHAGDFLRTGKACEIIDFFDWIDTQQAVNKIIVPGNHDRKISEKIKRQNIRLNKVFILENSGIEIGQIKFWGIHYVPHISSYLKSIQGIEENKEQEIYSAIPSDTNILITHNAPRGILDRTSLREKGIGSEELFRKVSEIKLQLHVFGHVHYQYGVINNGATTFVNASLVNDAEEIIHEALYLEIAKTDDTASSLSVRIV